MQPVEHHNRTITVLTVCGMAAVVVVTAFSVLAGAVAPAAIAAVTTMTVAGLRAVQIGRRRRGRANSRAR